MKMPGEGDADVEKTNENGEIGTMETGEPNTPFKHKYRELKGRLKCLVYERECFESELQKSQSRLLELTTEKSVLLDQLMRYEPILLTDDEDELTDYSASEDETMNTSIIDHQPFPSKQPTPVPVTAQPVATIKSTGTPSSVTSSTTAMKPNELTKHGIAKAAAIINSVSEATVSKAIKAGTKRQAKGKVSTGAVSKIAKTVARTRDPQPTAPRSQVTVKQENSVPEASSLVISLPLKLAMSSSAPSVSTHTIETRLNKAQSPVELQNQGTVQVKTIISQPLLVPPPPGSTATSAGASVMSSSSTGSSSSSSSSDSEDSGSESSSSSPDEPMETGGPVAITSMAKNADQLPRPKAISSPVKVAPPSVTTNMATPPPLLSPLASPGVGTPNIFSWTKPPGGEKIKSPSSGLMPIAPSLSSPPSTLPFSSLNKPNSAFQIVSPRLHTPSSIPLQDSTAPSIAANSNNNGTAESSSTV